MKDELFEQVGLEIRRLRLETTRLSQEAFARETGLDRAFYGRIERGQHNISLRTLRQVAAALDVPVSEILRRAEEVLASDAKTREADR